MSLDERVDAVADVAPNVLLAGVLLEDAVKDELFLSLLRVHHQGRIRRDFARAVAESLWYKVVSRVCRFERWAYSNDCEGGGLALKERKNNKGSRIARTDFHRRLA